MQKSKLIARLRLLEKTELRLFEKFIETDYFNKDQKVVDLYKYLKKYFPTFESKKVEKNYILKKVFPTWGSSGIKKMSYVASDLNNLLDTFFINRELKKDEKQQQKLLLEAYDSRGGDWFFTNLAEQMTADGGSKSERSFLYFFDQFQVRHKMYTHHTTRRTEQNILSLNEAMKNLDYFYANAKFRYAIELIFTRNYLNNEQNEVRLLDALQNEIKSDYWNDQIEVFVYAQIVKMVMVVNFDSYQKAKRGVFDHFKSFSRSDKRDLITMLLNYCVVENHRGKNKFIDEIFDLYVFGLDNNIWPDNNLFEHQHFDNIVTIGCLLGKFEWVEHFIDSYYHFIQSGIREDVRLLALANLYFSKGAFDETLSIINEIDFVDVNHNWRAKLFQLRCYFELDNYEELFYDFCNSFAQYCRRNKTMGNQIRTMNLNFIHFIKQLRKASFETNITKSSLLNRLDETELIQCRQWLRQKVEALK